MAIVKPEAVKTARMVEPTKPLCQCETVSIRLLTRRDGVQVFVRQCGKCGATKGVAKATISYAVRDSALPVDEGVKVRWTEDLQSYWEQYRKYLSVTWENERQDKSREWWAIYNSYLETAAWTRIRSLVFKRAVGTCEACGVRPPTQVHHLTYDHVTAEFLFELVAVCTACHQRLHAPKEESNGH